MSGGVFLYYEIVLSDSVINNSVKITAVKYVYMCLTKVHVTTVIKKQQ